MSTYVPKPPTVQAFQYLVDDSPEWFTDLLNHLIYEFENGCWITDQWGAVEAAGGQWIVLQLDEQIYVYSDTVFNNMYELETP